MKKTTLFLLSIALAFGLNSARAAIIMDQIGSDANFFTGQNGYTSQQFEASFGGTYDAAVVDNFSASASTLNLTNVQAAFLGFNGFSSFSNVSGYYVQIYSSLAAAGSNLTGDVASVFIAAGNAMVTSPFSGDSTSGLVSLDVNINLPSAGTYYLGVMAALDFNSGSGGELAVYATNPGPAGSTPGDLDAEQANPGGGFGNGPLFALDADAAYRITAVPEPSTWAALFLGGGLLVFALRARRLALS